MSHALYSIYWNSSCGLSIIPKNFLKHLVGVLHYYAVGNLENLYIYIYIFHFFIMFLLFSVIDQFNRHRRVCHHFGLRQRLICEIRIFFLSHSLQKRSSYS